MTTARCVGTKTTTTTVAALGATLALGFASGCAGATPEPHVANASEPPAQAAPPREPEGRTSMQGPGTTAPGTAPANEGPGGVRGVVRDIANATDRPGQFVPVVIEANPLGLFIGGRVSFSVEWVPVMHHAIEVNPHFVHTSADIATGPSTFQTQTFSGFGGELGYRYYTGHRGPNGIFVGPSLILGEYTAALPSANQSFTNFGVAADVGVQGIFWDHLVVGGGLGVEYLTVSHDFRDLPTGPSTIASRGFKPRLILEAGYGF